MENFKIIVKIILVAIFILIALYYMYFIFFKNRINSTKTTYESELYRIDSILSGGFVNRGNFTWFKILINDGNLVFYFTYDFPKNIFYGPYILKKNTESKFYELYYILKSCDKDKQGNIYINFSTKFSFLNFYKFSTGKISEKDYDILKQFSN